MNIHNEPFPYSIFRAYDIRGKLNLLTPNVVHAIGYALACQLKMQGQHQAVIGYDARLSSPYYAEILEQVLVEQDIRVVALGCCSTPQMYFAARETAGNGIMVTASHNAKTDNGIKWIVQGQPPSPEMIQQIAEIAAPIFNTQTCKIHDQEQIHQIKASFCLEYQNALLADIKLKRSLKVVLDGLNGSAGRCADLILQKLGCEVISIRSEADGHFPDHAPDPSLAIHLKLLQSKVLLHQADLGIALDGDGDRVVLLDENAKIISPDRLLALFAEICLSTHPAHEFVMDVKCSTMVKKTVEKLGGLATMIRTGSSFMRRYLSQTQGKAVFGGEFAGHYVFNDGRGFGYDDGIYAALRVMEYLSNQPNRTLSDILAVYPERFSTEDSYIKTYGSNPQMVLNHVEQSSTQWGAQIGKIDGIRLDFEDGFGIMRVSNTGDFFTVRFDAGSSAGLDRIRQNFVSMLSQDYPDIAHDILNTH